MADHPDVPRDLIDTAMRSSGAGALLHRLGGEHEARNLRTDISAVLADVLDEVHRLVVLDDVPYPRGEDTSINAERPRGSHRGAPASPWRLPVLGQS